MIIYTNVFVHGLIIVLFFIINITNDLYFLLFYIKLIIIILYSIILCSLISHYKWTFTYENIFLLNFSVISLCWLLTSTNFVTCLLCLELYSYIMYIIVTSKTNSILSSESGLKYIILGALSLAFILLGMCILYFKTGTLSLHELIFLTNNFSLFNINLAYLFILIGIFLKLGVVPFHMWYLDIYQNVDYWILAFIGSISKLSLITFLMILILHCNLLEMYIIKLFLVIISFLCLFIGNLMLLLQLNFKKLFLYYSIQSNALVLVFIILQHEWMFLIYYIIIYIITYIYIILLLNSIILWSTNSSIINIYTLLSFITINPILSWHLIFGFLTLASLPPFILFFLKILILIALNKIFFFFCISILFTSTITLFVFLRIINIICFNIQYNNICFIAPIHKTIALILSTLNILIMLYFPCQPFLLYILYIII